MTLRVKISWTAVLLAAWLPASAAGGARAAVDCPSKTRVLHSTGEAVVRAPGSYIPEKRGPSSRSLLKIDWKSISPPPEPKASPFAKSRNHVLPVAEALAMLAGEDRRPLLVLRECALCAGSEDALLSDDEDNEHAHVLARWFHCVRLAPDVLGEDHPFKALFPGEPSAHVFISAPDGSARRDFSGTHTQAELCAAMEALIAASYRGSHGSAQQKLARYLDVLDEADRQVAEAKEQFDRLIAQGGDLRDIAKRNVDVELRTKQRDEVVVSAARIATLELRAPAPAKK